MPEFFIADVRKRANPDFNMSPQAIPEKREFPEDIDAAAAGDIPGGKDYLRLVEVFGAEGDDISDDPVACGIAGCEGLTMEWTSGPSFGQIDFYGAELLNDEPQRFLSLYIFSGARPDDDRAAMKPLEQYADFAQCLNFPLVLQVTDDPLAAAWQHTALQSLRQGVTPLVAAFLKAYFSPEKLARTV